MEGECYSELVDRLFACLSSRRRRYALVCLRDHQSMTLADLADEVAVMEHDRRIDEIPADAVMRVYLSLYHTHVPKLEAADLVEYYQSEDSVTVGDDIEEVAPFISLAVEGDSRVVEDG